MSIRYFVDPVSSRCKVCVDGAAPPQGAIEVDHGPADGRMTWNGSAWTWTAEAAGLIAMDAIQVMIDERAREKLYDSGVSLASYVVSTVPAWAAEAAAFVAWRDAVWAYAYQQLALIAGGQREVPTLEDFMTELPELVWP